MHSKQTSFVLGARVLGAALLAGAEGHSLAPKLGVLGQRARLTSVVTAKPTTADSGAIGRCMHLTLAFVSASGRGKGKGKRARDAVNATLGS